MFRYALIFGSVAGIAIIVVMTVVLTSAGGDHSVSEALGYLVMLVVLSLIFVGVKRYRDIENGGAIRFGPAFGLGVAIAVVAAVFYVGGWEIFLIATDYAFIGEYSAGLIEAARDLPAEERAARIEEIEASVTLYRNLPFRLLISFVEIIPVGLLVALVSAALLRNPRFLPARRAG